VQATIERHAPGFGSQVVGRAVSSPAGLQAENANPSTARSAAAWRYPSSWYSDRPRSGRADTPIDRLYLASARAPGRRRAAAPGSGAARAALARNRTRTGPV
jgi:phytoene dehydrogenase-like protein